MRSSRWSMLREFIRDPFSTGTVCSSSPSLCKEIAGNERITNADVVVELGAGTGSLSKHLLRSLKDGAEFISIEKNPHLYKMLVAQHPHSYFLLDCAENLPTILRQRSVGKADVIISSLPWASFSSKQQRELTQAIRTSLKPNGTFITYAYVCGAVLPSFSAFRKQLTQSFCNVDRSRIVWNNFPPAFLYQCRQPVPVLTKTAEIKSSHRSKYSC
ncbi:class I SAM-dependent methyltransferase [Halodesulfovibrio aestuarii]|uniref:Class I SAM-dependent methyltransferase n=1 Tax=Halodesulfovibrio aestuarii TaxID=126333 RepID=A0ABV4JT51_9BACT